MAISSASLGKMVAMRGLEALGSYKVGALTWMVVVLFLGWLREMQSSLFFAESEYNGLEVEESKQMISCPASRSSLKKGQKLIEYALASIAALKVYFSACCRPND